MQPRKSPMGSYTPIDPDSYRSKIFSRPRNPAAPESCRPRILPYRRIQVYWQRLWLEYRRIRLGKNPQPLGIRGLSPYVLRGLSPNARGLSPFLWGLSPFIWGLSPSIPRGLSPSILSPFIWGLSPSIPRGLSPNAAVGKSLGQERANPLLIGCHHKARFALKTVYCVDNLVPIYLKNIVFKPESIKNGNPELPAPGIPHHCQPSGDRPRRGDGDSPRVVSGDRPRGGDGDSPLGGEYLSGDCAGGREAENLTVAAKGVSLGEGDCTPYAGETAGACPHNYAVNAFKVELLDPVAVPALPRRPLYVYCLHITRSGRTP